MPRGDGLPWRVRLLLWWINSLAALRKPRLKTLPYGVLQIGTVGFPVDEITLRAGGIHVTGEMMNPFPGGLRGAGWPRTYRLLGTDGQLIREGRLRIDPFAGLITTSAMSLRITVSLEILAEEADDR